MEPTYSHGHHIIVNQYAYSNKQPARGQVIVLNHPSLGDKIIIKRVVALPKEHIELYNGYIHINGERLNESYLSVHDKFAPSWDMSFHLSDDQYFVIGDNRVTSLDSFRLGPVRLNWIIGKVWFRCWPLLKSRPKAKL